MEKQLYFIQSYIPSDEDIVVSNIYKLISFGHLKKKHGFICVNKAGGYGTSTDDFGKDSELSAVIEMLNVAGLSGQNNECRRLDYMSFEDAISLSNSFKIQLNSIIESK